MKTTLTILAAFLTITMANAKTYTLGSGKWSDAAIWGGNYIGSTIKVDDVVIIQGQVNMNISLVVEGTLQVEKGAGMVGMKDLMITKSGKFINDGNTVMKRIMNEGNIKNNMIMEAMMDIENKSSIENNNVITGNNFDNFGGNASGKDGVYFVNNNINASPSSKFGADVKVFTANVNENQNTETSILNLEANLTANSVELHVANPSNKDISMFSIEKSIDGINFVLLDIIAKSNQEGATTLTYTDSNLKNQLTYYRVKAINSNGEETVLPIATVKAPMGDAYTMAY